MSFILDALKKSESERQRQSGPGVFQPRIASPRARFPVWAVALGLLLGVNLLILIWVMTRPDATPAAAAVPAPAAPASPAPASTVPVSPAAATGAAAIPGAVAPTTRFNPPLIVDPALDDPAPGATDATAAANARNPAGAPFNPNDYVPAQPAAAGASTPLGASADMRGSNANYASRDALVARGQSVPEVALSLHVYDPDPAKRFVFVNGQRGSDGSSLPGGLRIEQIVPEGAVLSWNGNRFLVPIQ